MIIKEKLTPQNLEAEQSTLGACLFDSDAVPLALDMLREDDFYRGLHKKIWQAIQALHRKQEPVDITTVAAWLRDRSWLEDVGGSHYLSQLIEACPSSANVESYATIVFDKAQKRNLLKVADGIMASIYAETDSNASTLLGKAEQDIMQLARSGAASTKDPKRFGDYLPAVLSDLEYRLSNKGVLPGIPTGLRDLDRMTGGLPKSGLTVLAARPSMGKTALAMQIGTHVAQHEGKDVLVFSLEMTGEQMVCRVLANQSKTNSKGIEKGDLSDEDVSQIVTSAEQIEDIPIFIEDNPDLSIAEIKSIARRHESKRGTIGLIIVDYLALVKDAKEAGKGDSEQVLSQLVQAFKTMARQRKCPVLLLSQLARKLEERENKRPILSDIKGSGSIEAEADNVYFAYRDSYYRKNREVDYNAQALSDIEDDIVEIIIAKQRSGPVGTVELKWTGSCVRFDNLATSYDESGANGQYGSLPRQSAPVYQGPLTSQGVPAY